MNSARLPKGQKVRLCAGDELSLLQTRSVPADVQQHSFIFMPTQGHAPTKAGGADSAAVAGGDGCDDLLHVYELREVLGKGSFAVVRRGVHRVSGDEFAIKIIAKRRLLGARAPTADEKERGERARGDGHGHGDGDAGG